MQVKCGNKKLHGDTPTYHNSAAEVKACYMGQGTPEHWATPMAEQDTRETVHREMAKGRKATSKTMQLLMDAQRNNGEKLAALGSKLAPKTEDPSNPLRNGMTQRQHDFLLRLIVEKDTAKTASDADGLTKHEASKLIGELIAAAKRPAERTESQQWDDDAKATRAKADERAILVTQDGVYRNPETGEIFKVQFNRGQGDGRRLYAKQMRIVGGDWPGAGAYFEVTNIPSDHAPDGQVEWVYRAGLILQVRPEWRMTLEEAKTFGALYGQCMRCGRDLTNETSIEAAMGPVCRNKRNWA